MSTAADLYPRPGEFERLLEDAEAGATTDWEEEFVSDIKTRFETYGDQMFISSRQMDQLERIASK